MAFEVFRPPCIIGDRFVGSVLVSIDLQDQAGVVTAEIDDVGFNRDLSTDLMFVRVEPYVIPKKSLTGESTERVDTRVLQVIYALDPSFRTLYVGQQVDVFIAAEDAAVTGPEARNP